MTRINRKFLMFQVFFLSSLFDDILFPNFNYASFHEFRIVTAPDSSRYRLRVPSGKQPDDFVR